MEKKINKITTEKIHNESFVTVWGDHETIAKIAEFATKLNLEIQNDTQQA